MKSMFLEVVENDLTKEEQVIYNELVEFYFNDSSEVDTRGIKSKLDSIDSKLNSVFSDFIKRKINLIDKEKNVDLVYKFIFSDFRNYKDFLNKMGMSASELRKLINSTAGFMEKDVCVRSDISDKLDYWISQEDDYRRNKLKIYDDFLYMFLNSRYYASNIKQMTGVSSTEFLRGIEQEDMFDNYPVNISETVMNKTELLSRLRSSRISEYEIVRDIDIVSISSQDVFKVSSKEYKRLETVKDFLNSYGNFDKMSNNYRYNYNLLYYMLDVNYLKHLLNDESLQKVINYLDINIEFSTLSVAEKINMVKGMIKKYYMVNGNILKLIENGESEEKVLRLLSDDLVSFVLKNKDREIVLKSLKDYSDKECAIKFLKKKKKEGFKI